MLRRFLVPAGAAAAVTLASNPAAAHAPIPGIEGFYVGLLHPLSTPGQILALLALGLMLGLRIGRGLPVLVALAVGLLVGVGIGQVAARPDWAEPALLFMAIVSAAISALSPTDREWMSLLVATGATAGIVGMLLGINSTPDPGPTLAMLITLSGSFFGIVLISIYVSGGVVWLREKYTQQWVVVGIRVVAAWIGAVSILMAALIFAEI